MRSIHETPVRTMIVDDSEEVRFLLSVALDMDPRFEVIGECEDAVRALDAVRQAAPDLVLVDLRLGHHSGWWLLPRLREIGGPDLCLAVVTASASRSEHAAAITAGADAVVSKCDMTTTMTDDLASVVHSQRQLVVA